MDAKSGNQASRKDQPEGHCLTKNNGTAASSNGSTLALEEQNKTHWPESKVKGTFDVNKSRDDFFLVHDKVEQHLRELNRLRKTGADHTHESVQASLEQLRQLLCVSKEQWLKPPTDASLDLMVETLQSELQLLYHFVKKSNPVTTSQLLKRASDGMALKGLFVNMKNGTKRTGQTVLSEPTDVELQPPSLQAADDEACFSCKDHLKQFLSSSLKGKEWRPATGKKHGERHQSHPDFEACVLYVAVPTAACKFDKSNFRLSAKALEELQSIGTTVKSDDSELVNEKCQTFLKTYGSHINAGVFHFGGVNKLVATYEKTKSAQEKTTEATLDQTIEEGEQQNVSKRAGSNEKYRAKHELRQENSTCSKQDNSSQLKSEIQRSVWTESDWENETQVISEQKNQHPLTPQQKCEIRSELGKKTYIREKLEQDSVFNAESNQSVDVRRKSEKQHDVEKKSRQKSNVQGDFEQHDCFVENLEREGEMDHRDNVEREPEQEVNVRQTSKQETNPQEESGQKIYPGQAPKQKDVAQTEMDVRAGLKQRSNIRREPEDVKRQPTQQENACPKAKQHCTAREASEKENNAGQNEKRGDIKKKLQEDGNFKPHLEERNGAIQKLKPDICVKGQPDQQRDVCARLPLKQTRSLKQKKGYVKSGKETFSIDEKLKEGTDRELQTTDKVITSMLQSALRGYTCLNNTGLGPSVKQSVFANDIGAQTLLPQECQMSKERSISFYVIREGGPQELNTLSLWKMGLVSCNSTWVIIDRTLLESENPNLVGIWELVRSHREEITDSDVLATALEKAWECLGKYHPVLADRLVKTTSELVELLKDKLLPALDEGSKHSQRDTQLAFYGFSADMTGDLALCLGHLLDHLYLSEQIHEAFFLKTALLHLQYEKSTKRFESDLTLEKLKDFVGYLDTKWKAYEFHRNSGCIQLDAFLIHFLLESGHFHKDKQKSEDVFCNIVRELKPVVQLAVDQVLQRHATPPFNWGELYRITGELARGNLSATEDKEIDLSHLAKLCTQKQSYLVKRKKDTEDSCSVKLSEEYSDILDTLGLTDYYPSKISILDVTKITMEKSDSSLNDLPWQIIQKLVMIDFHAFDDLMLAANQLIQETESVSAGEDFDLEDFVGEKQVTQAKESKACKLSTLDVLVAIFGCSNNFLKQLLAQKLFMCKLAIPFIYSMGSPDTLLMSFWALRTIVVECPGTAKTSMETTVTDTPIPVVTFLRLGRPPLSKSKLMNDVLSNELHNTFFHYDCDNGNVNRRISSGMVECAWMLSTEKTSVEQRGTKTLPVTTMLLNLRGDASSHEKQLNVLIRMSSIVFVVASAKELASNPHTSTYRKIFKSGSKVILLLMSSLKDGKQGQLDAERQACADAIGKENLRGIRLISSSSKQGASKNASELKLEARTKLSELLTTCDGITIEDCAALASQEGIISDERCSQSCIEGKTYAKRMMSHLMGRDVVECKRNLLPLQGAEWQEYCTQKKKQHRSCGKLAQSTAAYEAAQLGQEMDRLRKKQVEICHSRMPFIRDILSILVNSSDNKEIAGYFLHWLKLFLDKKSRENLPGLRRRYRSLWEQFQEAKKEQDKAKMQQMRSDINRSEKQLAMASFGLENIFREFGQMYECLNECVNKSEDIQKILRTLSQIAAEELVRGHFLELVDGDASSVPITWICSVLSQLEEKIGNKKLLVLSVLGIQSSGKSTLLNAMFGLQFAVSAGRCTRGAYMQLIPVDGSAELPYDYLAVIDTEGLRASELGQLQHSHDNELATLVIGLGDVTLMNIKGENTAEMKDILQIAVHAFLRMSVVSKNIRNHRTCMFLHQNVAAVNAEERLMPGCQKLQECLDEMAQQSADIENIENVHSFSQIINFDVKRHVWYFSDLWHGNPPMAPVNPGYSEKVRAVKRSLLKEITMEQTTFLTVSDLSLRINDLWNGILADDFVFSFRNSLEVKAYKSLESVYYALEWDLHSSITTWLQEIAIIEIRKCDSMKALTPCCQKLFSDLSKKVTAESEKLKCALKKHFEESNLQEIIVQWQQAKLIALDSSAEERYNETKADLHAIKEARRIELIQIEKWSQHEVEIMEKAITLADQMKGTKPSDKEMQVKFDDMWVPMVHGLASKDPSQDFQKDLLMESILFERYRSHADILKLELASNPLCEPALHTSLEDVINLQDIEKDHVSLKISSSVTEFVCDWARKGIKGAKRMLTKQQPLRKSDADLDLAETNPDFETAKILTLNFTKTVLQKANVYLEDLCQQDVKFQKSHAVAVIQDLKNETEQFNLTAKVSGTCSFKIRPVYEVKLAVYIARHSVQVFTMMQHEYEKRHGVAAKLEKYRETAWNFFKNSVNESAEEVIAGDLFCSLLKGTIEETVKGALAGKFVDEIMRDLQMTKHTLIVKMMEDLARNENKEEAFNHYYAYIRSAKSFALKWLTNYTKRKMFKIAEDDSTSIYQDLTSDHIKRIKLNIDESVKYATRQVQSGQKNALQSWAQNFCNRISQIAVSIGSLKLMTNREVVHFDNLQRIILAKLKDVEDSLIKKFAKHTADSLRWEGTTPYQQILDKIWGCSEQCPFCHEPCDDRTVDHYRKENRHHHCVQHRPQGVPGYRDEITSRLITNTCGYLVQSYYKYQCWVCFEWQMYRDYNKCFKDWNIAHDPTDSTSKYWMWFLATYQKQLASTYKTNLPEVDASWTKVTRQDALDDLNKFHN